MNILPLVLGFLLLFSFLSYSFLQESASTVLEETHYVGYMNAQREARNAVEQKKYYRLKRIIEKGKGKPLQSSAETSRGRRCNNRRTPEVPYEASKFNFATLFVEKNKPVPPFLYETATSLLRELYQHTSFYRQDLEYRLVDALISVGRTKKGMDSLIDLYPDDPLLKAVFYKMLKGTQSYEMKTGKGIAPLTDFISFDPRQKTAVSFHFASPPILKALFGEKTATAILELEHKKRDQDNKEHALSKQEIAQLIGQGQTHVQFTDIESFFNFSKKYDKISAVKAKEDKNHPSGIVIKRKF